jgi:hypothetical protein
MKSLKLSTTLLFIALSSANCFQAPSTFVNSRVAQTVSGNPTTSALAFSPFGAKKSVEKVPEVVVEEVTEGWTDFGKDPITYAYGGAWALLVTFAFFLAPGELSSASDNAMIQSILENPTSPDMNIFYYGIFNVFAIIPVVLACTISPRASSSGIPSGPPLFLSTFIAYFIMGPYLALRKAPKTFITNPEEEFGWITRNIWENKIVNYGTVALGILCLSAGLPGFENPAENWNGMIELIQTSRFASVSLADLSLITLILTKEVADDYKIRCDPENVDKAPLIGASTALLPILGAAIYCAARPSFEKSE